MASPRYQPVGPIDSTNRFLLVAFMPGFQNVSIPYVATVEQNGTGVVFLPVASNTTTGLNRVLNNGNLIQFQITGTLSQALLTSNVNNRALLPVINRNTSEPTIVALQDPSTYINPYIELRSNYSPPPAPHLLLSGAAYTMIGSPSGGVPSVNLAVRYQPTTGGGAVNTITTQVYPIAVNYVASLGMEASMRTCSTPNNDPVRALQVFYCSWCGGNCVNYCSTNNIPGTAWTNLSDCNNGFNYVYCTNNVFCGQNGTQNCYAACSSTGQDCRYAAQTRKLVCVNSSVPLSPLTPASGGGTPTPPTPPGPAPGPRIIPWKPLINNTPWYSSWWFIISVIVIILLVLVLIYVYSQSRVRTEAISNNPELTTT